MSVITCLHTIARKTAYLLLVALLLTSLSLSYADAQAAPGASFTDTENHWAKTYIDWAVAEGLVNGYEDGSFKPDKSVSEIEFLAMLLRAYHVVGASDEKPGDWSAAYYDYASLLNWPVSNNRAAQQPFLRGDTAIILQAAVRGQAATENQSVQWLLDEGISKGRASATIAGFDSNESLTRAESLTFLFKLKQYTSSLSDAVIPQEQTRFKLQDIALRDSSDRLVKKLGEPARIEPSGNNYNWYVYNSSYSAFAMFGVSNGQVVALYAMNPDSWTMPLGLSLGESLADIKKKLSAAAISAQEQKDISYSFSMNDERSAYFIDSQSGSKVIGLLHQLQAFSGAKPASADTDKLRNAMERELFDLVNAERAERGISLLKWDDVAATAARKHSEDMMKNHYFSHTNQKSQSPFDRMKAEGVSYSRAAENIASGYANSILTHYILLNSTSGHRETILDSKLSRLGTGVAFGGEYGIYYTQDYFTPN
ncbi:CAP-associated domain-containing protein [Paenibacillus sp. HB172176]|uniref:CAP-associated domain-containing protein n=1 Tax=Paenibacillus sp. HB172176 TaxID=2493690 RepID=UPI00143BCD98|nr:CAP-associated domain-containing protein [Paenibacillus sp. HB172176]